MRVLLIDVNCKSGSTGKIVYDLYTQLRSDGHDAAICYGRGNLVKGENIYRFAPKCEIYLHALLTRIIGLTGYFSPIATRRLIWFIEQYQPNVVHINELHAYFANHLAIMEYLKKKNIKTVWTFHCEYMYTGKCGHAYECVGWQHSCGHCPHLQEYPKSQIFDFTHKMFLDKKETFSGWNSLTIVTPSQWLADRVKQSFLENVTTYVVHNGIDTENVFYPRFFDHLKQRHGLSNQKIVLAVAPDLMSQRKGGRYVLQLAEKLQGENIKFILIGVADLSEKFPNNVIALGRTENQQELAEHYSMADVFVICSEKENFPTTCLEAICCGTPVVGFDVGGTAETAPSPLGKFVPYGSVELMTHEIMHMLSGNTALKKQCTEFGKRFYSKQTMYQNMSNIYLQGD